MELGRFQCLFLEFSCRFFDTGEIFGISGQELNAAVSSGCVAYNLSHMSHTF